MRIRSWMTFVSAVACLAVAAGCPTGGGTDGGLDGGPDADVDAGPDAGTSDAGGPPRGPISQAELTRMVTVLAGDAMDGRKVGTDGGVAARAYVISQLQACGVTPAGLSGFEQPLTPYPGANVLGRIPGTDPVLRDRVVIVSAHYDHLGHCGGQICNGANDNAAAVAAVIGVGCSLAASPAKRTIEIISWDAEEPLAFLTNAMGSQFYGNSPVFPLANVDVAVVLDLFGTNLWPGYQGTFMLGAETSDAVASAAEATIAATAAPLLPGRGSLGLAEETVLGHQPWSDYDTFRNHGVPVLFMSDGQNRVYHTPSDEVSGLDLPKLGNEAGMLLDLVWRLGNATETPTWRAAGTSTLADANTVVKLLQAALGSGGMITSLGLSAASRTATQNDLTAAQAIQARLAGGGTATAQDVTALRHATQRVMCHCAGSQTEVVCNSF